MDLAIRYAQKEDIPFIAQLERRCFATPWSEDSIRYEIAANPMADFAVAIQEGALQGYVGFWVVEKELCINNVAVAPEARRCHVGTRLLNTVLTRAATVGIQRATLEVRVSNAPAIALYTGLGFESAGIRPHYYQDNGEDAIIMWRTVG